MQIHGFTLATEFAPPRPQHPFEAHACPDLATFKAVNGGDFCTLPAKHGACHPGFRPYRCADGRIVGIKV